MPRIIALAQQKGGVGKSTLAIHMAVELTIRRRSVVIIDMDPQATVMKWRSRRKKDWPLVERSDAIGLEDILKKHSNKDFIFLDTPGRRATGVNIGMRFADFIIIPARPFDIDIEASGETLASAQRLGKPYAFAMTAAPAGGRRSDEFTNLINKRGFPVLPIAIIERLDYPDAIAEGLGVAEWRPSGKAATEIAVFTDAVLKGLRK